MSHFQIVLAFAIAGVTALALRVFYDHAKRGRVQARRLVGARDLPYIWRLFPVSSAGVGVASLVFGSLVLWPRPFGLLGGAFVCAALAAIVIDSYRTHPRLMAGWMRREVEEGSLQIARPDIGDWLIFIAFVPTALLGVLSIVLLVAVFGAGR